VPENGAESCHHDRPETERRSFADRRLRAQSHFPAHDGKVEHYDGVLHHDADQHNKPIMAATERSILKANNVNNAPTPADGRPEMMTTGWIELSYRMPSRTYAAKIAANSKTTWPFFASSKT
jgi:hypothetical protein